MHKKETEEENSKITEEGSRRTVPVLQLILLRANSIISSPAYSICGSMP